MEKKDDWPMFKDLGGIKDVLDKLTTEVLAPLYHPNLSHILLKPISCILLHGPPGCGKTALALAIAKETGFPIHIISANELVSCISSGVASEVNIRDVFSKTYKAARSIVFIDKVDAFANLERPKERHLVTELVSCMDDYPKSADVGISRKRHVLVIGTANSLGALDPALRRVGRFDQEIFLGVPDENARVEILSALTRNLILEDDFDAVKISRSTLGFVGADLRDLVKEASRIASNRIHDGTKLVDSSDEMPKFRIKMVDFEEAANVVHTSPGIEGFCGIPNVKWVDIGGLDKLRLKLHRNIVKRIKYPNLDGKYKEMGFLLIGPRDSRKTLIAKAVANEAGANFIHIKVTEFLNKYTSDSGMAVAGIFSLAKTCSPCILFFDEVEDLTTKPGNWNGKRLVDRLWTELEAVHHSMGVYVVGATNRLEVDPTFLQPERFGKVWYVPLPNEYACELVDVSEG